MPTLFEKIINREIPAEIIYEDESAIAFKDIAPQKPVHVLIVPRTPIPTLDDISAEDEQLVGHLVFVASKIARDMGINKNGYRLICNCRDHGGQQVYHLHLHLLGGEPVGALVSE